MGLKLTSPEESDVIEMPLLPACRFSVDCTVFAVPLVSKTGSLLVTYAVVASFVLLSLVDCVVAVVPFGRAGVPDRLAAVPVVFWLRIGMSAATMPRKV